MRRWLAGVVLAAALIGVGDAQAASPHLGFGEATRAIGANLHREFPYGAVRGSLVADCWRRSRSRVGCEISFQDYDGDYWCGIAYVREGRVFYRIAYRGMGLC